MSTLMFWNKQNGANQNNEQKNGKKNWLHTPDALVNGHIAYPVKFLGSTPVDQPKGIEVVKEAIRRLQFSQQIKKAESGNNVKTKKVEITVSINGVAIQKQENKVQIIMHQFPLHKISYCADEKGAKKFFSFIAKTGTTISNGNSDATSNSSNPDEGHECFVFISNKLASDITLTIGQAFDLAYRRYVNDTNKNGETGTLMNGGDGTNKLPSNSKYLENAVLVYQNRLKELSDIVPKFELDKILQKLGLRDICELPVVNNFVNENNMINMNGNKNIEIGIDLTSTNNNDEQLLIETSEKYFTPAVPPRNFQNQLNSTLDAFRPSVGTKLEGLLLNSDSDSDFDPRASESDKIPNGNSVENNMSDLFGFEPPKTTMGQQLFTMNNNNNIHNNIHMNNAISNGLNNGIQASPIISNGMPNSPAPLLAPPPKAAVPRRVVTTPNKQTNQDLFGSAPFSPFDATPTNFATETINTQINDTHINLSDTIITNDQANPFKNATISCSTTSNIFSSNINNPLTLSNNNYSNNIHNFTSPVFNEISTFSNNFEKLDTILIRNNHLNLNETNDNNNNNNQTNNNISNSNSNSIKKLNPFAKTNNKARSKSPSLNEMITKNDDPSIPQPTSPNKSNVIKQNPFGRSDSFLNRNLKYDAFKNALDDNEFNRDGMQTNYNNNINSFGGANMTSNLSFNTGSFNDVNKSKSISNFHEFSNKLIDPSASFSFLDRKQNKFNTTNSNHNNGLIFGTDDFTLESLDPLRK